MFFKSRKQCKKCLKTFFKPYVYTYNDGITKRKESPCCKSEYIEV